MNTVTLNRSRLRQRRSLGLLSVLILVFMLGQLAQAEHIHGLELDDQLHCELCQSGSGEPAVVSTATPTPFVLSPQAYSLADSGLSQIKRLRSWQARAPPSFISLY